MMRARPSAVAALVAFGVIALVIALGDSGGSHELRAQFAHATNLVSGAAVTAGGVEVGKVGDVAVKRGIADVTLHIDDDLWPLTQGTRAALRFGGTVSYASRYVELTPGKPGAPALADGAVLRTRATVSPVEFDELLNTFNQPTRSDVGSLVDRGADTLGPRGAAVRDGLASAAPALDATADVFQQLGYDPYALRTLVAANARVAGALRGRQPQLHDLVDGMATTFSQLAQRDPQTRATLRRLPGTLTAARTMLARLDPSLRRVDALTADLAPGARGLRALAPRARGAISALSEVAPQLDATLATASRSAPAITGLLNDARPFLGRLAPVLRRAEPMVACLRSYTPEISGFFTTWTGLATTYDANGHYGRVLFQAFPYPNGTPISPTQALAAQPGLDYTLLRPPGYAAGTPWMQPQCGAGANQLDASKDPESRR